MFDYDDLASKEGSWSNFPAGAFTGRQGVQLGDLTAEQRTAALAVVASLLSEQGYIQVLGILAADDYLGANDGGGGGANFGSDNYTLALYGAPSSDSAWTMQFGGHHLAVHVTVGGGTISASPFFTGVEPLTFTQDGVEYSPMVAEQDAVFGLLDSLDDTQLAAAKLSGIYDDLAAGPGVDNDYPASEGILYGDLTADQQALVRTIIGLWVGDADESIAQPLIGAYESQLAATRIAWAGSTDRDTLDSYLRIDGPRVWIEYINTKGQGAVHCHTVYRDKTIDYGTGTGTA